MKKSILIIFGCWCLVACGGAGSENTETAASQTSEETSAPAVAVDADKESPATSAKPTTSGSTAAKGEKVDFDFLTDCNSLETWRGALQGVPATDSPGIYIMGQCFANRHYDVIVYSRNAIGLGDATEAKTGNIKKGLPGATYYAFEIPKKEAADPEDELETFEYVFPSEVKVYRRYDDGWHLINRSRVSSFEQLGRLKQQTINPSQTNPT